MVATVVRDSNLDAVRSALPGFEIHGRTVVEVKWFGGKKRHADIR